MSEFVRNLIYVGPYVEAWVPVISTKRNECRKPAECTSTGHGFCSSCGIEAAKQHSTIYDLKPGWVRLCEDIFKDLYASGMTCKPPFQRIDDQDFQRAVFIAAHQKNVRQMLIQRHGTTELTYVSIPGEIRWFKTTFEESLGRLSDFCEGRTAVRWGLVND